MSLPKGYAIVNDHLTVVLNTTAKSKIVKCIKTTKDMWDEYVLQKGSLHMARKCQGTLMYEINGAYYYPSWFEDANLLEQVKYYNEQRRKDGHRKR